MTITREIVAAEITASVARGEASAYAIADRLCGRSASDHAYFDRTLNQMISDGVVRAVRVGFIAAAAQ